MTQFRQGDKVKRQDGRSFSNGQRVLTVDRVLNNPQEPWPKVWLEETGTNVYSSAIELAAFQEGDTVRMREESNWFGRASNPSSTTVHGTVSIIDDLGTGYIYQVEWPRIGPNCYRFEDLERVEEVVNTPANEEVQRTTVRTFSFVVDDGAGAALARPQGEFTVNPFAAEPSYDEPPTAKSPEATLPRKLTIKGQEFEFTQEELLALEIEVAINIEE